MSSEPAHPWETESALAAIDGLLDDLARLSASTLSSASFHAAVVQRIVDGLDAAAGAIWLQADAGQWRLEGDVRLNSVLTLDNWADQQRHVQLLAQVVEAGEGRVVPCQLQPCQPLASQPQSCQPQAPNSLDAESTKTLLVLAPFPVGGAATGILEICLRGPSYAAAQKAVLRLLAAVGELAADFHRNRQLRELRGREGMWSQFEQFSQQVHASLDVTATAYAIANEGSRLIGCDRLSIGLMRGRRCRLSAVSGLERFDRRSALVRSWETLAKAVAKTNEPLWYASDTDQLAPQIESTLHAYLEQSPSRLLAAVPIKGVNPVDPHRQDHQEPPRTVGILIIERFDTNQADEAFRERVAAVCRQGGLALKNAREVRDIPLLPLWRAIGHMGWLTRARQLPKTLAALALVVAAAAVLTFVPADFTIESRGELQPTHRREVFARTDGIVSEVRTQHAARVSAGDVLAVMRRPQLDLESTRILGDIQTASKRLAAIQAARLDPRSRNDATEKYNQLTAEEEEVKALLASLTEQQKVLRLQQADLELTSPIDGVVLTWNVDELLAARPVARGQALMRVADLAGPWELKLRLDDDRVGHVVEAQRELEPGLEVSFMLATDPGVSYAGRIERMGELTESDKQTGASVPVTVSIDRDQIDGLRPGATVIAKIHCGRRSLGYVWFHGIWEKVQSRLLF